MATSQIENVSTKELESILAKRRAQDALSELQTKGVKEFKNLVSTENSLAELAKIARAFGARVYSVERILNPPTKKEKKAK